MICGSLEERVRNSSTVRFLVREMRRVTWWPRRKATFPACPTLRCQAVHVSESRERMKRCILRGDVVKVRTFWNAYISGLLARRLRSSYSNKHMLGSLNTRSFLTLCE